MPQDYPVRHFERMVRLAEHFKMVPAQLLEHSYSYQSFGSWWSLLLVNGQPVRIVFDGREGVMIVERSSTRKAPYDWSESHRWTTESFEQRLVDILAEVPDAG